jgi:hypothetical protein
VVGFWVVMTASVAGLLAGCGDGKSGASESDGASASEGGSGGSTEPTGATGTPTEGSGSVSATEGDDAGSISASMSGTTEISGGMSASMSGSEDSGDESTSTTTTSTTGMVSGSGETSASSSSTGEPIDCTLIGTEAECVAADCMAIVARPFFDDGAIWCLEAPSFLACAPQIGCDDAITTACKGQTKYQFKDGCLAPGFEICAAPPDAGMDGYPDCA